MKEMRRALDVEILEQEMRVEELRKLKKAKTMESEREEQKRPNES